jgi:ribonuclease E
MPLPRSLLCVNCNHTYPEGWKRCPYCGYDEKKAKDEARAAREAARRNPVQAKSSAAQQDSRKRRGPPDPRRRRGSPKPAERVPESRPEGPRPERPRRRARAGSELRRRGQQSEASAGAKSAPDVQLPAPGSPVEQGRRPPRRRRGRARGERSAEAGSPSASPGRLPPPAVERAPAPAAGAAKSAQGEKGTSGGEGRSRRRRRPRRGRSRNGQPGDGSSNPPSD